jgi:hypothetical protein
MSHDLSSTMLPVRCCCYARSHESNFLSTGKLLWAKENERSLRAKQQVGGREGVAALLVDGNSGESHLTTFLNDIGVATQRLAPPS